MANVFHVKGKEEIVFDRKNVVIACDLVNGKITHVDVSSEFIGVVFAGDEILTVNGEGNIKSTADFNKAIQAKLPGKITIEFLRDDHCLVVEKSQTPRRPNTIMTELTLTYRGGAATGLIIHRMSSDPKTVLISMVQSPSNACKYVKSGDILVKVNDIYVLDRDAARKLIYTSVNNTKCVRMTLERSTTMEALGPAPPPPEGAKTTAPANQTVKKQASAIAVSTTTPSPSTMKSVMSKVANKGFDVMLPTDVLEIMKNNKDFYKKPCKNPPCIIKTKDYGGSGAMKMESAAPEVKIPFDPSPKPLKATPKRVGS